MSPEHANVPEKKVEIEIARVVLITFDGLLCIGKRKKGTTMGGYWCLVGGKAESSNLPYEVIRETSEELGVEAEELLETDEPRYLFTNVIHKNGRIWKNNYFMLEFDDYLIPEVLENFNRDEFSEIDFVDEESVKGRRFAFGDGDVVRFFFKFVGN
jgi:8-oxo-dGTP pyrophosphatase MutT (NUDIX family)